MTTTWRPIFHGALQTRAVDSVRDIAIATAERFESDSSIPGLMEGLAGAALLFAYLDRALPNEAWDAIALRTLGRAGALLATTRLGSDFSSGFPGVVWSMRHIERMLRPDAADRGGSIDEALAGFLARTPWRGTYDLIAGVAGHGVYALERLDGESARHCAESVVERIAELAEPVEDGSAWHTPARLLPPHQAAVCPNGYYNLGLAHGVPSVIAVLALLHRAGVMPAMSRSLAAAGMRWLVSLPWANEHAPGFPAWLASLEDRPAQPARIAWCYGDLGVAAAMSVAARAFDDDGYRQLAVGIARRAATRGAEESGVVDAGLCHGAAGVAHAFNRLYQATGDDSLRAAAHEWCCRALEMRGAADGVAGYRAFVGGDDQWESAPGLLTGATGIALALLAAATDVEPSWDRALLLS